MELRSPPFHDPIRFHLILGYFIWYIIRRFVDLQKKLLMPLFILMLILKIYHYVKCYGVHYKFAKYILTKKLGGWNFMEYKILI